MPCLPLRVMDYDLSDTLIHIETNEAARRFGQDCFDLRCIMNSRGDTLSEIEVLEMLRALNRNGSIFTKVITFIPPMEKKNGRRQDQAG